MNYMKKDDEKNKKSDGSVMTSHGSMLNRLQIVNYINDTRFSDL